MKPRKILLIDDDSDDRTFFNMAVNSIDSSIILKFASNGLEGLEVLNKEVESPPDVIFLDINMPVMDGRECLRELKSHSSLNAIPVFVLTTSSNPHERRELINQGAQDYISKPSDINKLVKLVGEVIQNFQ